MPRRKSTDIQKMPFDQQQAIADRLVTRQNVRAANDALFTFAMQWVTGESFTREEFFRRFNASGHRGEYHMNPGDDTKRRIKKMQQLLPELRQRVKDTPLDFMGIIELNYVLERINLMLELLAATPEGTMDDAIKFYEQAGDIIREKVHDETDHWPEEFELPLYGGRITGEENPALFKAQTHQPSLLGEPGEE